MTPAVRRDKPATVVYAFLDLNDGGAQRLTLSVCRHLDRSRYRPLILCARGGGALVPDAVAAGIPVVELGRLRRPYDLYAIPAIARILRAAGATIVHVPLYSRSGPYVRAAARLEGVRLVVAHEWCRPAPPDGPRRWVDRFLAPGTRFIATSAPLAEDLVAAGVPPAHVQVVHSGIDVERFPPLDAASCRAAIGVPEHVPLVLVPARLHPMKGHVDLIAAVAILTRQWSGVRVLCAGTGPLRAVLPALADAAGLADSVCFLGHRSDMGLLLGACDVVALASHVEGLPSAVLEAFAAERAVVATAVGGVTEVVRADETGWLVEPRSPRALSRALADALSHPDVRSARAARGRAVVIERFRAETTTAQLQRVYDRWLGVDGGAPAVKGADGAARPAVNRP